MAQVVSDTQRSMGQVTAMAMLDEAFRARLEASPREVLGEFGIEVPGPIRLELVSDPAALDLPRAEGTVLLYVPDAVDLSEEELAMVAGATPSCSSSASTMCTLGCLSCASTVSTQSCAG